jgi:formylmethanofuran dehydrogenase subunit E
MLDVEFMERRSTERRRHIARCSHRSIRRGVSEKCVTPALWRCTGCGQLNCQRHRVELDDPSLCNHCTSTMVRFVSRRISRRREEPPIFARG